MGDMRVLRWFAGSWVSRIYLALVAAVTIHLVVSVSIEMADSGHSYRQPEIILLPLTMPGVLLTLPVIDTMQDPWWLSLVLCVTVGALINAVAINGVAAALRRRRGRNKKRALD